MSPANPGDVRVPTVSIFTGRVTIQLCYGYVRNTLWGSLTIAQSPVRGENVVQSFVDSAQQYGIGHGFYYSVVVNNFLNVQNSGVLTTELSPGQVGITNSTYDQIVLDQLTDLWTNYGNLTEVAPRMLRFCTFLANMIPMMADLV